MIHNNLILHYPFNGNAEDASGRAQHGKIFQAFLATNKAGIPNKAFQFLSSDSYIYAKLKKYDYKNCTISFWACWQQERARAGIFYVGHSGCNGFGLILSGSSCDAGHHLSLLLGGVQCDAFYGNIKMPSFEWNHICLVKKGAKWILFLNGEKAIEVTHHYNTPDELFSVGGKITNINDSFGGILEDFRWYNRALNPIEIQKIFNA